MSNATKIVAAVALATVANVANAAAPVVVPAGESVASVSAPVISDAARAQILDSDGWVEARHSKTSNTFPCAKCHTKHSKTTRISELTTTLPAGATALTTFEDLSKAS